MAYVHPPMPEGYYSQDPRLEWDPAAKEDTHYWQAVLKAAGEIAPDIQRLLHLFRVGGLRLVLNERGLIMVPIFSDDVDISEYSSKEQWEEERKKYLLPHKDTIKKILYRALAEII